MAGNDFHLCNATSGGAKRLRIFGKWRVNLYIVSERLLSSLCRNKKTKNLFVLLIFSLPPPQAPIEQNPNVEQEKPVKTYARLLDTCRKKMSCKCCKRKPKAEKPEAEEPVVEVTEDEEGQPKKISCFNCRKKKAESEERVNLSENEATAMKKGCWERLKCCGRKNKTEGKGCCSRWKRKEKWAKRMDSILSEPAPKP